MNKIVNYVLAMILLLAVISPVQAALIVNKVTDEFSLESPYPVHSVKGCECGTRAEILEIKNLGDFDTLFKVEIFSPIIDLISVSDDTFNLAPGETQKVFVYIQAPCDTSMSTFYSARVSTNYGRSKEITKEFVSQRCQNIKYASEVLNDKIMPGDTVKVKIDIQNVAEFTDTFKVTPNAYQEYTKLSDEQIELAPDQTKSVYMYITLPLPFYGARTMPFTITSDKAKNSVSGAESYTIERDYDYAIQTDEFEINACEDVAKQSVITFENLAKTPNKYYLFLSSPGFVNLSQKTLTLGAGEKDSIVMNINAKQKDIGSYELILNSGTDFGDMKKQKSFRLNINDCFSSAASIAGKSRIADKGCCGEKEYVLNIRNDGLYEETYEIQVDSAGWVKVDEENQFVRLRPSQQMNVPIKAELPCADDKQTSFVIVKQLKAPFQSQEIRLELESLSQSSCYNIEMLQESYGINYDAKSVPLLLQNTGLKGGTYKLSLGELESRFVYLENESISFEPGEMKVLRVYPTNYSQYNEGTYLNKLTLKISPVDNEITYDRQFWVVLKDKSFVSKMILYIRNFNYSRIGLCGLVTLVLLAAIAAVVLGLIYMKKKQDFRIKRIKAATMKKIKVVNAALITLLVLALVLLVFIGTPDMSKYYEQPTNSSSPLFLEWKQNTPYKVNLDQYFTDPDLDVLSYTASQPNHVQVKIEGNIATLTPEYSWAGTEHIVFTANDAKGGMTDGDVMTLHIMKKMPVGVLGYWNAYCKQINLALIMLFIVFCLMVLDIVEEKGYRYYLPSKGKKR